MKFFACRRAQTENASSYSTMRIRDAIKPPSGLTDHVSRREAAALLGYASEFKVRQLEKEGRLRAVRGVMGSAWYPRKQVLALREVPSAAPARASGGWTDAALLAHLRERPRSVVDLVVDTGIPIARAERVYRFWLSHDTHPTAAATRGGGEAPPERRGRERVTRDGLLGQMRDPDPAVRAAAFAELKKQRADS
jgi:hypothetical protein